MQGYAEGWKNGEFVEKMDVQDCLQNPPYHKNDQGHFAGHFWHFHKEIDSKELHCLSFQGNFFQNLTYKLSNVKFIRNLLPL